MLPTGKHYLAIKPHQNAKNIHLSGIWMSDVGGHDMLFISNYGSPCGRRKEIDYGSFEST